MEELILRTYPDEILNRRCDKIDISTVREYTETIDKMLELAKQYNAAGLAAPQIGLLKQIIIFKGKYDLYNVLLNPKILGRSKESLTSYNEGCLSFPNIKVDIRRSKSVIVEGFDKNGETIRVNSKNKYESFALQHEIDHLNGVTILQRAKRI